MKKNIFLVSYSGGHITIMDLLCEKLIKDPELDIRLLALTGAYPKVINKYPFGVVKKISDYVDLFDNEIDEIIQYGLDLIEANYNQNIGLSRWDTIMYMGLSYFSLVKEVGVKKAEEAYKLKGRQAFGAKLVAKTILEHERPDLVVVTTSPRFEYAFVEAALELGIETMQISDLFGDNKTLPLARHIVTMNNAVSEKIKLKDDQRIEREYHAIGQPVFDQTKNAISNIDGEKVKERVQLQAYDHILLFSPVKNIKYDRNLAITGYGPLEEICEPIFEVLDEVINAMKVAVIVRPHPNDPVTLYEKYFKNKKGYYYFPNDSLNLFESISISDAVLSYHSTIVLQAVISGKQGFTYNKCPQEKYIVGEYQKPPFIYSEDYEVLKANLKEKLPNQVIELDDFYKFGSTERISKLINTII